MAFNSIIDRSDAGALIPEDAAKGIIGHLPEGSVVMRMGRRLPNMTRAQRRLPVLSALPIAYFVGEAPDKTGYASYKQTTELSWANKYLDAEEIAAIVPIPESVLDDADYDIWGETRPLLVEALGRVFDAAVLYGTNAPAAWPDDILTAATAAGNVVNLGTGADLYDDLLGEAGVISKVEEDGFLVSGHIGAMAMRSKLRGVRSGEGVPIFTRSMQEGNRYELDGSPIEFPRNGVLDPTKSLLVSGAFSELVWAMRTDVSYKLLTEAVITDPSDSNKIIYNLAQQDMVALRVTMRIAWQVPNPINRVQGAEANRYPFAVLAS